MRKINKPNGLIGVNGKKPIAIADILPYLPNKSGFIDTRHWVWGVCAIYIFRDMRSR